MAKEILLTQGKVTIVDDEDYEWLNQWKWQYAKGYAIRPFTVECNKRIRIRMHRLITGCTNRKLQIDHRDCDSLNNQRSNLRICKSIDNSRNKGLMSTNTSGFKGVHRKGKSWIAIISTGTSNTHIGAFRTKESAANAYNHFAKIHHGEFANLNEVILIENWLDYMYKSTVKFKGVYWREKKKKWESRVYYNGKGIYLGIFDSELEAAKAYNIKSIELFGESAVINDV